MKFFSVAAALVLGLMFSLSSCSKSYKTSSKEKEMKKASAPTAEEKPASAPLKVRPSKTIGGISVTQGVVCQSVENRTPMGEGKTFTSDVGRLYAFTKVGLDEGQETSIKHIWHYNNKEMATVTLPIRGPQWRTYSSKAIDPSYKGNWKVNIVTEDNQVLKTLSFKIQ